MKYEIKSFMHKSLPVIQEASIKGRNKLIDEKIKTTCKAGCSSCCSRPINITLIEAAIIMNLLKRKGLWERVRAKASELQEFDTIDRFTWFRMKIMCPVLDTDTNLCLAYENRPMECALHYVTSPAKSCDPWGTSVIEYKKVDNDSFYHELVTRLTSIVGDSIWVFEAPVYKALLLAEVFKSKEIADQDTLIQAMSKERI